MTLKPFYNEEAVTVGGDTYRLVLNFRALDAIETLLDRPFDEVLSELSRDTQRLSLVAKVLWGLLREEHGDLTLDQTASLMFGEAGVIMGAAVQKLLDRAFSAAPEGKGENPPKPRGASSRSSPRGAKKD